MEYVKSLGAAEVFDYKDANIGTKIRAHTKNKLRLVWDTISNAASSKVCAEALSSDLSECRYASFLNNKSPRTDVVSVGTMLYTIWGEYFRSGEIDWAASAEDFDWAKQFAPLVERLLSQGKIRTHRVVLGKEGFAGIIAGLRDMKDGLATNGKLVYRIADTPD
jgi:NADPH:quinone reductase-like Zn-dependent oxidoreductase